MEKINHAKINVSSFLPPLMEIIGNSDIGWDKIDRLFSKKIEERIEKYIGKEIEASIYDIIIGVRKGDLRAIRFLDFLNKIFSEILLNMNDVQRKLIEPNIKNILKTLDKRYLNYVGEIAVINNLVSSKTYTLEGVETIASNGKGRDFKLAKVHDNTTILVEIVNIHPDETKIENDKEKIKKFFTDRLTQKIEDKKKSLSDMDFFLVPVIWGGWKCIKIYSDYFKENKMHLEKVNEPVAYASFSDDTGFFVNRFGNVSNLFNSN